jgi:hypothetical protein
MVIFNPRNDPLQLQQGLFFKKQKKKSQALATIPNIN